MAIAAARNAAGRGGRRDAVLAPASALALLAGATAAQSVVALPSAAACAAMLVPALVALCWRALPRPLLLSTWLVLGAAWALLRAGWSLDARLPLALEGEDLDVVGHVVDLPQAAWDATRFEFFIEQAAREGTPLAFTGRVRASWYAGDDGADVALPLLAPCARWALRLRLKRPRGLVNPGGFDFERHAAQRGIVAVGYVRPDGPDEPLAGGARPCVDGWRQAISGGIAATLGPGTRSALLQALAVGDQHGIDEEAWQVLRATGIGHLIAISGLHVGLFAAFGALLARLFWKAVPRLALRWPGSQIEAPAALATALGYSLLAGFGVPTVRTLLMIAVALLARHSRRGQGPAQALGLAAAVIVLVDPLAVLAAGFWLSFGGVAALMLVLAPRAGERAWWRELPRAQLALSLALLPLTAWLFGQGSLVGPFANLLAVPWIGFVVVPLVVAGSLLLGAVPLLGAPLLHLADLALLPLWRLMEAMAALPAAQHHFPAAPAWAFALSVGGIAWLLSPRGIPARPLGLVLLLPLLVPSREVLPTGAFSLLLVDVGQGLSVLVRTRSHVLLFDAGARYPSGFDLGEAAVAPALHALGIGHVDRLVISHGDNDHAGGARSVALAFTPSLAEGGEPGRAAIPLQACHAGEAWHWDGVDFRLLGPPSPPPTQGNDRSCVLEIEGAHASALLPGDISRRQEPAVAAAAAAARHPLVLVVPHHGSNGSSSAAFLDTLQPDLALVSTGYRNRFGHPHPAVRERYRERGIPLEDTAQAGYLAIEAGADGLRVRRGRDERDAWWREGR